MFRVKGATARCARWKNTSPTIPNNNAIVSKQFLIVTKFSDQAKLDKMEFVIEIPVPLYVPLG